MKELVIINVLRTAALPEGKGAFVETSARGPASRRSTTPPEETRIPRAEIARIARSLEQALKRFESGAEMRQ